MIRNILPLPFFWDQQRSKWPSLWRTICSIYCKTLIFRVTLFSRSHHPEYIPETLLSLIVLFCSADSFVRTHRFCIHLLDMLSPVTLLVYLIKDYGLSLRKGLNTDFHPGLILLSAGILSRMHFRRIVNVGPKRKASECTPFTTGKMNFYALLT